MTAQSPTLCLPCARWYWKRRRTPSSGMYSNHPSAVWFGSGPKMKDMFCYIAAARTHVNLGFCRGASLSDPDRVLEGEGKTMRHIKFRSERDVERPFVR